MITKLTITGIMFSGLEKLVTVVLMRLFPYRVGEFNVVAVQIYNVLGLELGMLALFAVSVLVFLGMKKGVDIYPGREKTFILFLVILTTAYACIFIYNSWIFISLLQGC